MRHPNPRVGMNWRVPHPCGFQQGWGFIFVLESLKSDGSFLGIGNREKIPALENASRTGHPNTGSQVASSYANDVLSSGSVLKRKRKSRPGSTSPNRFDLFEGSNRFVLGDKSDAFGQRGGADQTVTWVAGICWRKLIRQDGN